MTTEVDAPEIGRLTLRLGDGIPTVRAMPGEHRARIIVPCRGMALTLEGDQHELARLATAVVAALADALAGNTAELPAVLTAEAGESDA